MKYDVNNYDDDSIKYGKNIPYIDRDVSWVSFNERVLHCAHNKDIPLNERVNFLAITESNLDEFISVRFASVFHSRKDKKSPYQQLIHDINKFNIDRDIVFRGLMNHFKNRGIIFAHPSSLNKKEIVKLDKIYDDNIFPLLSILDIDNYQFPSGTDMIGVMVQNDSSEELYVIPIHNSINNLINIDNKYLFIDDVIEFYLKKRIFINKTILDVGMFRVIKDGSVILSHDQNKFIIDRMKDTINQRNNSNPLYLEYKVGMSKRLKRTILDILGINKKHVMEKHILNYRVFSSVNIVDGENYKPFEGRKFLNKDKYYSIFDLIDREDILLQHPYDSYDAIVKFIDHASKEKDVLSIKQTLYRVSSINSPIVNALCTAAENGKMVTVLVEIKARFDEINNIRVIEKLRKSGCIIVFGDEFKKTHCKMCIVTKANNDGNISIYSHIGTGNYNEKTSKIYTDISYLTSKKKIGNDLLNIFNIISGHAEPDTNMSKVFYSPVNLRKQLIKSINNEIKHVKHGKKGEIVMKVNSISDPSIIKKLYEAADAGVHVEILARGICSILPRKNLVIKSLVGRFLEHSRIYYFKNGKKHEYYISSADLLPRNLDRRVEILLLLTETNVISNISKILNIMRNDTKNTFILDSNKKWVKVNGKFDSHKEFMKQKD